MHQWKITEKVRLKKFKLTKFEFGYDLYATFHLDSDVPLQYFDWKLYDFKRKIDWPKNASAMAVAFISNCRFMKNERMKIMRELIQHGVTVHSYGEIKDGIFTKYRSL